MAGLTEDDIAALAWAVGSGSRAGQALRARLAVEGGQAMPTADEIAAARREWEAVGRPAHRPHVHRTAVAFGDGTRVTGVSFAADAPYERDAAPAFGLYLDERWSPPWPHEHIDWPDFGVPDRAALAAALDRLLARARAGDTVEIGCIGGHGRTGTALACLAVKAGVAPARAVAWVRANYCDHAVETVEQELFVAAFT